MKRTKLYEADATGRSTGETFMTASVTSVLLMPRKSPDTITATVSVSRELVKTAMTSRSALTTTSTAYRLRTVPNLRCTTGATKTDETATRKPQPKKT